MSVRALVYMFGFAVRKETIFVLLFLAFFPIQNKLTVCLHNEVIKTDLNVTGFWMVERQIDIYMRTVIYLDEVLIREMYLNHRLQTRVVHDQLLVVFFYTQTYQFFV